MWNRNPRVRANWSWSGCDQGLLSANQQRRRLAAAVEKVGQLLAQVVHDPASRSVGNSIYVKSRCYHQRFLDIIEKLDDPRTKDALDLLEKKRDPDGTWHAEGYYWSLRRTEPIKAKMLASSVEVVDWGRAGP